MIRHRFDSTAALAALLSLSAGLLAQDRVLDPAVPGRNAALRGLMGRAATSAAPGVVQIFRDGREAGFGALLDGGWVVTAEGVVASGGAYEVRGAAGTLAAARAGRDAALGVALLRLTGATAPAGLALGRSADLGVGQLVACAGTDGQPLAAGVVSATARRVEKSDESMGQNFLLALFSDGTNQGHQRAYPEVIHHDAPLLPEQLGSPLIDAQGRLVGVNVATPWRGSTHAVPIDAIRAALPAMQQAAAPPPAPAPETPRAETPRAEAPSGGAWLGVYGVDAPRDRLPGIYRFGVLVEKAEGPAAAAGVRAGDVLVLADGNAFQDLDGFADYFARKKAGDQVRLGVVRESKLVELQVTLGAR